MAQVSVSKWTPFGVALDLTAGNITITRTSASKFTVHLSVSWKTSWSGAETDYGMDVTSGGVTKTISTQGTKRASGSGSLTGTYSINTNGASTVPISITFKNYNTWAGRSATKSLTLNVSVPAWPSWKVSYNLNGGSGSFPQQTKWKGQSLTLHKGSPTKTGYTFQGWTVTSSSSTVTYKAGAVYTGDAPMTLTAVWKANTYKITYYANGGTGAPGVQTKTYGVSLKLSSTIPTREKYKFKGWGNTASTTTVSYQPGATYTSNTDVNLYAVWELAYTKPVIEELLIHRVVPNHDTGDFDLSDHGKSALVEFDWFTFQDVTSITIECNSKTYKIYASGKSGVVEKYIGDEELSDDSTYTIKVSVSDGDGPDYTTSLTRTLPGTKFAIDFRKGATGAAIGKPAELSEYFDIGYKTRLRDTLEIDNGKQFYGYTKEGTKVEFIHPINENGNVVIGYGNYDRGEGNTNIYGYDVHIGVSNMADPGYYRPYRRQGDSINFTLKTAGYVTNGGKDVTFIVPFSVPIIGSPTVAASSRDGFVLRQGEKYTHGSSASEYVNPETYTASISQWMGVTITASFNDTTNVINNNAIGIYWSGTITFT